MTASRTPETVGDVVAWLDAAPQGTLLPVATLRSWLTAVNSLTTPARTAAATWRERLWTAPAEARLGVVEVAEAMGRPKSWVYRRTCETATKARLPHRKLDGELVFTAGEIRAWIEQHETIVARPLRWLGSPALRLRREGSGGPPADDLASLSGRSG